MRNADPQRRISRCRTRSLIRTERRGISTGRGGPPSYSSRKTGGRPNSETRARCNKCFESFPSEFLLYARGSQKLQGTPDAWEVACPVLHDKVYVPAISLQRVMGEILHLPVLKLIIYSRHTSSFSLCESRIRIAAHTHVHKPVYRKVGPGRRVRGFPCISTCRKA